MFILDYKYYRYGTHSGRSVGRGIGYIPLGRECEGVHVDHIDLDKEVRIEGIIII